MPMAFDAEDWFFKYAEGTIKGFVKGNISMKRAKGMLLVSIKAIGKENVSEIMRNIESPIYLRSMSREEKVKKLEFLKKELFQ